MSLFDAAIGKIVQEAARNHAVQEGDYQKNGLWYCGKCNTQKQTEVVIGGTVLRPMCQCQCAREAWNKERQEDAERQRMLRISQLRTSGLEKADTRRMTFESDEGMNRKQMAIARRYVKHWKTMRIECLGLLLWGNKGAGKTFVSACIANALIDQNIPVLMTSMVTMLSSISNLYSGERIGYLRDLGQYDLLIIDDFGAEHSTDFAMSQVYNLIDQRYTSGKPMIVNTNLTLDQLRNPPNITLGRIYDRILERCVPVEFRGDSIRVQNAERKHRLAAQLLGGGVDG